jgi:16S rRNA (adenine1518-N6/adenine1519-N6)-dimethyltransferase
VSRQPHPPPRKRLGQHFLSDPRILARIAESLAPTQTDTVVEIGPGRGALTEALLNRAGRVIAIELDATLADRLSAKYSGNARMKVVQADVLDVDLGALAGEGYLLAGNVPYYITTPILFHALRAPRPARAIFLVQREVAERIVAPPGNRTYGALSVNVQALARAEQLFRVSPGAFQPPPKVDSAVIRISPLAEPLVDAAAEERFEAMVIEAFGMRRKQMRRVARTLFSLDAEHAEALLARCGIDAEARPETLSAEQFSTLEKESRGGNAK